MSTPGYPPDPPLPPPSESDTNSPWCTPGTPDYERVQQALQDAEGVESDER